MKTSQIFLFALMGCTMALGQTNTFPASGNVGIGTTSPTYKLQVDGSGFKLGGSYTQTNLRIEATDDSGAPAKAIGLQLHGYEGRAKGIYITDKDTSHKWFIGEGYAYNGIGIGYSTTSQMEYSANTKFFVGTSGNVGIGTTSPGATLHVNNGNNSYGTILANADESSFSLYAKTLVTQPANVESFRLGLKHNTNENNGYISFYRSTSSSGGFLGLATNGLERIRISKDGNVGIGTAAPDDKLTVKGRIHAEEVKVDLSVPGPDYVFKEGYDLKSLEEVQQHIREKGHLPNIPSAAEMEENGVELGIMNMKLLEKIEELTLYQIQLLEQLEVSHTEIEKLKMRVEYLESK